MVLSDPVPQKVRPVVTHVQHCFADKVEMSALELGWHNCLMGDVVPEELQQYAK